MAFRLGIEESTSVCPSKIKSEFKTITKEMETQAHFTSFRKKYYNWG